MKKNVFYVVALLIAVFLFSCKQKEKLPLAVNTVKEAKQLIMDKTWQVVGVATIQGQSIFDDKKLKSDSIVAPPKETLTWLTINEDKDKKDDFINSFYTKTLKISIALNKDSIATTKGMDSEKQIFSINNDSEENEPKGIKLTLTGSSEAFGEMGAGKFTTTYYVLGASNEKLYLLTPNKLNSYKVVFLLEAK